MAGAVIASVHLDLPGFPASRSFAWPPWVASDRGLVKNDLRIKENAPWSLTEAPHLALGKYVRVGVGQRPQGTRLAAG
ncbi:hypothetical protein D7D52_18970 [Nocardia yunnanensis]|uniref:Uncharacterized protein n=1 Tax=Nocardia yunnanensis TaxID=2382165 RepID=A0A386ZDE9_9NOCA|nr:hypothetical protein D7D52_18970 [Nocardia yunnanensis]